MSKKKPFNFPTDSESVRNRNTKKPPELDTQKRYEELSQFYLSDFFTNQCYKQIENITKNALNQLPELKAFPIKQILLSISKKLLMNELEFLFLGCLLDELKWQYSDPTIKNYASGLKPLIKNQPVDNIDYKCIELYFLLAAYSVKVYLNQDIKIFEGELNDMLVKFQQVFHTWGSKFAMTALSTNPKKLNKKYIETSVKKSEASHEDLNRKVNQLVQTNPTTQVKQQVSKVKVQPEAAEYDEEVLPPPPGLYPGLSDRSFMRGESIPFDMYPSWSLRQNSFIDFPLMRQPSDSFGGQIPGFGKLQQNSDSDRLPK